MIIACIILHLPDIIEGNSIPTYFRLELIFDNLAWALYNLKDYNLQVVAKYLKLYLYDTYF